MHISRIDLNLFVVLDAVYREGSVSRAAKLLNLTQPALSHALGRLRDMLQDPLFIRQGARMVPTPMAHQLIGPVREALQMLEVSINGSSSFEPASAVRNFTLGFRDVMETVSLPRLAHLLQQEAPGISISSTRVEYRELEAHLANGKLDLGVDVQLPLSDNIRRAHLAQDTLVVVTRNDHPLIRDTLSMEDYLAATHVLVSSRRTGPGLEDMELSRLGLARHIRIRCQHYLAACHVVSESDLLLTMPAAYASVANRNLPNRIHALPFAPPPLDIYLYWHQNTENDPANRWLRTLLTRLFMEDALLAPPPPC